MKENKRLQFIMDMVDKVSAPAQKVTKSLQGMGKDVTETQKKLAGLHKRAGDISKLAAMRGEVEKNTKTTKEMADKVQRLKMQMLMTEKPTKAMREAFRAATKEQREHNKASDKQKEALSKLDLALKKAGIDTNKLGDAERQTRMQMGQTNAILRQQSSELDRATRKQESLTKAKEAYGKAEAQAGKMMGMGAKGMAAGGAMMAGTYAAGSKFTSYDHQLSAVQAVGRLSQEDKLKLSDVVEELAAKSSFNANQAAGAAGFMAQAGFGKDEIMNALGPVMQLAAATGSDLTKTADIASNIMGAFEIGADEMPRVADVLTMAANSFNVDLGMLGETMKYLAPVANKLGMSMEEATAMTGLLGNVGIQGSQAGNALKSMAGSLAAPNKKKDAILDKLGINAKDGDGNLRAMPELMLELQKKTKGMGNADLTAMFKTLFGEEFYGPAMEIVSKGGDVLDKAVKDMYESQGAAAEAERIRLDNLQGDFTKFGSAAEGISIKLGKSMDPIYRKLMGIANGVMDKINKWMKENPKLVRQIGMVAGALGAILSASSALLIGLGALWLIMAKGRLTLMLLRWAYMDVIKASALWIASKVKSIAVTTYQIAQWVAQKTAMVAGKTAMLAWNAVVIAGTVVMKALGVVMRMNPIGLLITAIGLLVAAGVWLYQNWERLPEIFSNLWAKITEFLTIDPMEMIRGAWDAVGEYFTGLFGGIWDSFMGVFSKIGDKLSSFGDVFSGFWGGDDIPEAIKDAPKAGETDPVVNGKPTIKGNQVQQLAPVQNNNTENTYQIVIHAQGMSAAELSQELDRKLAEKQRQEQQQQRARNKD